MYRIKSKEPTWPTDQLSKRVVDFRSSKRRRMTLMTITTSNVCRSRDKITIRLNNLRCHQEDRKNSQSKRPLQSMLVNLVTKWYITSTRFRGMERHRLRESINLVKSLKSVLNLFLQTFLVELKTSIRLCNLRRRWRR